MVETFIEILRDRYSDVAFCIRRDTEAAFTDRAFASLDYFARALCSKQPEYDGMEQEVLLHFVEYDMMFVQGKMDQNSERRWIDEHKQLVKYQEEKLARFMEKKNVSDPMQVACDAYKKRKK